MEDLVLSVYSTRRIDNLVAKGTLADSLESTLCFVLLFRPILNKATERETRRRRPSISISIQCRNTITCRIIQANVQEPKKCLQQMPREITPTLVDETFRSMNESCS